MDNRGEKVTAIELVQGQLDAYNERNLELFCTYFAEDVVVMDGRSQERLFAGMDAFRERYQHTFSNSGLHCHLLNRIEQGDVVIDHEEVSGMGEELVYAIAIYQIDNGRIQKVTFY